MGSGLIAFSLLLLGLVCITHGSKKLFCYYSKDARYRTPPGRFLPENIDPALCTHVIFAFFQPTADGMGVRAVDGDDQGANGFYARTVALKQRNPSLRVLLAIGGWLIGSDPFLPVIASQYSMNSFARNVVTFLRANKMDGMDMDWEFPGVRNSNPSDKYKFTQLLKTIQEEFRAESSRTGNQKLILTLATASGSFYITNGYEPRELHKHPDYLLLMTYNYHGAWENVTGHHSAVWSSGKDTGERLELNMRWTVDYWLSQGAPASKLVLGLATYGMTFQLKNPSVNGVLAPAYGGGRGAQYTNEYGIMAYYEVCENLARHQWTNQWLADQQVPYAYKGDQWVGYDNPDSLKIKVQTMINGYNMAGAFVWSVEMDDFSGHCGGETYPLLKTIVRSMDGGITAPVAQPSNPTFPPAPLITPAPTPSPTTRSPYRVATPPRPNFETTTRTQAVSRQGQATPCDALGVGIYKDANNCGQFFYCVLATEGKFLQYTMRCPTGLSFDEQYLTCVSDETCFNPAV